MATAKVYPVSLESLSGNWNYYYWDGFSWQSGSGAPATSIDDETDDTQGEYIWHDGPGDEDAVVYEMDSPSNIFYLDGYSAYIRGSATGVASVVRVYLSKDGGSSYIDNDIESYSGTGWRTDELDDIDTALTLSDLDNIYIRLKRDDSDSVNLRISALWIEYSYTYTLETATPTNLASDGGAFSNDGSFTLSWTNGATSTEVLDYELSRRTNDGSWTVLGYYSGTSKSLSLQPSGKNEYRLRARSRQGGVKSNYSSTVTQYVVYDVSSNAWDLENIGDGTLTIDWTAGSYSPNKYHIKLHWDAGNESIDLFHDGESSSEYSFTGLTNRIDYDYSLTPIDGVSGNTFNSSESKQVANGWQGTICGIKNPHYIAELEDKDISGKVAGISDNNDVN